MSNATRRMVRKAIRQEVQEARQNTQKTRRAQTSIIEMMVAEIEKLKARVTDLEKRPRL